MYKSFQNLMTKRCGVFFVVVSFESMSSEEPEVT